MALAHSGGWRVQLPRLPRHLEGAALFDDADAPLAPPRPVLLLHDEAAVDEVQAAWAAAGGAACDDDAPAAAPSDAASTFARDALLDDLEAAAAAVGAALLPDAEASVMGATASHCIARRWPACLSLVLSRLARAPPHPPPSAGGGVHGATLLHAAAASGSAELVRVVMMHTGGGGDGGVAGLFGSPGSSFGAPPRGLPTPLHLAACWPDGCARKRWRFVASLWVAAPSPSSAGGSPVDTAAWVVASGGGERGAPLVRLDARLRRVAASAAAAAAAAEEAAEAEGWAIPPLRVGRAAELLQEGLLAAAARGGGGAGGGGAAGEARAVAAAAVALLRARASGEAWCTSSDDRDAEDALSPPLFERLGFTDTYSDFASSAAAASLPWAAAERGFTVGMQLLFRCSAVAYPPTHPRAASSPAARAMAVRSHAALRLPLTHILAVNAVAAAAAIFLPPALERRRRAAAAGVSAASPPSAAFALCSSSSFWELLLRCAQTALLAFAWLFTYVFASAAAAARCRTDGVDGLHPAGSVLLLCVTSVTPPLILRAPLASSLLLCRAAYVTAAVVRLSADGRRRAAVARAVALRGRVLFVRAQNRPRGAVGVRPRAGARAEQRGSGAGCRR